MGASSSGGGAGGNTGPDAGFFISQKKKKSKLSKKNQDLVDAKFRDRGAVKISQQLKTPTLAILSGPLKAGSKVTRDFFTNKVLGSKNYKGTSKAAFEAMTVSQQESIYGDYMKGRQLGKTDAYGNPTPRDIEKPTKILKATKLPIPETDAPSDEKNAAGILPVEKSATAKDDTEEKYDARKTKRRGRRRTILTSQRGASGNLVLGKPTLLGA
jgi:hypothetical protein